MRTTIHIAQALLEQGRSLWEQDRYEEATEVLSRLLGLRRIPRNIAERAQFYLGDMQLAQGHYPKARRHLAAALATGTDSGETHFLMARALDWDEDADPRSAYQHYRRAADLDPGQPLYSSSYALMRIRQCKHRPAESLRRLRDAFAADPDDPDVVYNYVCGLMDLGRHAEAELALRRARKSWPQHPMFEELWYELLDARGVLKRPQTHQPPAPPPARHPGMEPVLLPFPGRVPVRSVPRTLKRNARLRTALETLSDRDVSRLGRMLSIPENGTSADQRERIRRALLDRDTLRSILKRLSPGSRRLIDTLREGRSIAAPAKQLRVRIDGPATHRPHLAQEPPGSSMEELRQTGIVFPIGAPTEPAQGQHFMIPSDLRRLLGEALA